MNSVRCVIIFFLAFFSFDVYAETNSARTITVKGLFKNAVLLQVGQEQLLIKVGNTKKGIKVIQATSKDATIEVDGKRQQVNLSNQVGGNYSEVESRVVRIASQNGGHHWVRGKINDRTVDFVVDTGASIIAMNLSTAKRLGIDYEKGRAAYSSTANGLRQIRIVNLAKVTVGEITLYNIQASVGLDDALPVTLLGNSFLSRTNMRIENGVLILEAK